VSDEPTTRPEDHGPARPWLTCVVPLVVFLVGGAADGLLPGASPDAGQPHAAGMVYPVFYAVRVGATLAALAIAWPSLRPWLGRATWWPPLLGALLVVPWVILATLQRDAGWGGVGRVGYDPFATLGPGGWWQPWAFLAVRWLGLVVVVPIAEELFLRGFLMRTVVDEPFWRVPFGTLTPAAAAACIVYAVATHPGEAVAAVGWFAIVSGIALATRRPIDCILAHAATNAALGAFVLATGQWWLM
jgi:CAAX prenyl protease-like protein